MKLFPFTLSTSGLYQLQELCQLNTYSRVKVGDLPADFPAALLNKCAGEAIIIGSGDATNQTYMVNLLRGEAREYTIDQQPLIVTYHKHDSVINLNAAFVNHGSWDGRTISVGTVFGTGFLAAIQGSGIEQYYPCVGLPEEEKGPIHELKPDSHRQAFWISVKAIKEIEGRVPRPER